jgi:hypothetical protein
VTVRLLHSVGNVQGVPQSHPQRRRGHRIRAHDGIPHAGHGRLLETARGECTCVVVGIFLNPIQFDRGDDCQCYPRRLADDAEFCGRHHVDMVLAPSAEEMCPRRQGAFIEVTRTTDCLSPRSIPLQPLSPGGHRLAQAAQHGATQSRVLRRKRRSPIRGYAAHGGRSNRQDAPDRQSMAHPAGPLA